GMPWSEYLVDSNFQLSRRIRYRHFIPPFRISQQAYRNEYRSFLKLLAVAYRGSEKIKLEEISMTFRCFSATSGNLASTAALIRDAFMMSKMEGKDVDIKLFADVVRSYGVRDDHNCSGSINPDTNLGGNLTIMKEVFHGKKASFIFDRV
ncbi:MAG TPA: hypothetical protein VK658_23180, partial [Chryseolinea sp.]|nr:hypothetical protein [Chryseolinea sp.]